MYLEDGGRQILAVMIPGELSEKGPKLTQGRGHTIVAATDCKFVAIDRAQLSRASAQHPVIGYLLLADEVRRNEALSEWLVAMGRRSALERVAYAIFDLHERLGAIGLVQGEEFAFPFTQGDLADLTGISEVHLNRVLQVLRGMHVIELGGGRMRIPDVRQLAALAKHPVPSELDAVPLLDKSSEAGARTGPRPTMT